MSPAFEFILSDGGDMASPSNSAYRNLKLPPVDAPIAALGAPSAEFQPLWYTPV